MPFPSAHRDYHRAQYSPVFPRANSLSLPLAAPGPHQESKAHKRPPAYILPAGVFRSVVRMGMGEQDVNPAKLLASPMGKKMYAGLDIEKINKWSVTASMM